jgi:hypothetical protein
MQINKGNGDGILNQHTLLSCDDHLGKICNGTSVVNFLRNDHVDVNGKIILSSRTNSNVPWTNCLSKFQIIVFNKGHHVADRGITDKLYAETSIETANYFRKYGKQNIFVYTTTSPAHPNCQYDSTLNTSILLGEYHHVIHAEVPPSAANYGWDKFHDFDTFHKILFSALANAIILDIAPMSSLRSDGHNSPDDCLHYRLPAVSDNWVYMLQNVLQTKSG